MLNHVQLMLILLQSHRFDVTAKNFKLRKKNCVRRILCVSFKVVYFFSRVINGAYHASFFFSSNNFMYINYNQFNVQRQ